MTDQNEEAEKVALNKKSSPFKAIKRHRLGQLSAVEKLLLLSASICALVLVTLVFIITSPMVKNSLSSVDVSNLSATVEKETVTTEKIEDIDELLAQRMAAKEALVNTDFHRRFPRDEYGSTSARRITYNLPRPLKKIESEPKRLSVEEKIDELLFALDADSDEGADPWELHEWMTWVQNIVYRHTLEDQWESFRKNETKKELTWGEYQIQVNPHGIRTKRERQKFDKDRRRWKHADKNGDEKVTKHEFKYFLFPQLSPDSGAVTIPEAFADLDTDFDGRITFDEFLAVYQVSQDWDDQDTEEVAIYYKDTLDKDQDQYLDVVELAEWVEPSGFVQIKSEVIYLMDILDEDRDKVLTKEEIMKISPKTFLSSQVTFFGQIYTLANLREEIFQFHRLKR